MTSDQTISNQQTAGTTPSERAEAHPGRRGIILASRMALVMLLIAGVALLGLGAAVLLRIEPQGADDLLRAIFGSVFGHMAIAIGFTIGIPAGVGVWAMSGVNAEGAVPALPRTVGRVLAGIAIATLVLAAVVMLAMGSGLRLLDIALIGVVALPTLGLAGAVAFSPHRGRAVVSAVALLILAVGIAWLLTQAYVLIER